MGISIIWVGEIPQQVEWERRAGRNCRRREILVKGTQIQGLMLAVMEVPSVARGAGLPLENAFACGI